MQTTLDTAAPPSSVTQPTEDEVNKMYSRVTRRLIPFILLCYIVNYLDRINVGFAKLQMQQDLGLSDAIYGLGAGIFFAGYFLFEVPSNLLLAKIGAKKTIARIMILWSLVSASTMLVTSPTQFYCVRFLLGVFEAGFFPGIILYLTYWYPSNLRARILAIFLTANTIAGIIGGPLSGWIMHAMAGYNGWAGWQWTFLLEAVPAAILGIIALFYLDNQPENARWLSAQEKETLAYNLDEDQKIGVRHHAFGQALRDPKIYVMAFSYFTFICGVYLIGFWMPTIIKSFGVTDVLRVGLLTAIPYIAATIGMVVISKHSDRTLERRWHCALCAFIGAVGLTVTTLVPGHLSMALVALSVASIGIFATLPLFWSIPTSYLSGTAAAGGFALINSLGLIGGFVSPSVIGWIKSSTGSMTMGLYVMTAVLVIGGIVLLLGVSSEAHKARQLKTAQ